MLLEAKFVILEEYPLHRGQILYYHSDCIAFWNGILEPRHEKVQLSVILNIVLFCNYGNHIVKCISMPCRSKRQDLFNAMGSMYSAILMLGIQNASGIQPVVAMERIIFYKERTAGMYSALPYTFAQAELAVDPSSSSSSAMASPAPEEPPSTARMRRWRSSSAMAHPASFASFDGEDGAPTLGALAFLLGEAVVVAIELPYIFIQTLIYGALVYTMIGFEWMATKFFWYLFFMYFTLLYFTFFGMMSVGLAPDGTITAIFASFFYGFWNLFSGFLIPVYRIPVWSRWCYWICPVAWTLYGLGASQFGDVQEKLETGETVAEFLRSYYGFRHELLGVVAAVIMAFAVAFAFIFGFSVKYINFQRK
ncbi:hypothetical protein EJB05_57480, partial [Eragrostis curvula]